MEEMSADFGEAVVTSVFLYSLISYYFMIIRWGHEEKRAEDAKYGGHWEDTSCLGFIFEYFIMPFIILGLFYNGIMWVLDKILPDSMMEGAEIVLAGIAIIIPIITDVKFIIDWAHSLAENDVTNNL